jgi:hypothetical protein
MPEGRKCAHVLATTSGDYWADGDVQNDIVTFSYDYLDIGFHFIIVEVYQRAR